MNKLTKKESEALGALIASIAYLENESLKLGFNQIAVKLNQILREIKNMVDTNSQETVLKVEKIRKSELFQTLITIEKIVALKELNLDAIGEAIEMFDVSKQQKAKTTH